MRSDIRSSFGTSTTTAEGVPMTPELTVLDLANGNKPFAGAAVYVWHCDRGGNAAGGRHAPSGGGLGGAPPS